MTDRKIDMSNADWYDDGVYDCICPACGHECPQCGYWISSDEAYFFESEDTLAELVKKKLDIVPELKDNKIYENNKKYHRTRMIRYSSTGRT